MFLSNRNFFQQSQSSNQPNYVHFEDENTQTMRKSNKNEFPIMAQTRNQTPQQLEDLSNLKYFSQYPQETGGWIGNSNVNINQDQKQVRMVELKQNDNIQNGGKKKEKENEEKEVYNPLKIPPDWGIAKNHAIARSTALEKEDEGDCCPCCGYTIDRQRIELIDSIKKLSFLGSGFPLFYNFLTYCIFILFEFLTIKSGYSLIANYFGNYCSGIQIVSNPALQCVNDWLHQVSLANIINDPSLVQTEVNLGMIAMIVIMATLIVFRSSQMILDNEVDQSIVSPPDYTIIVKNIPTGLDVDYKEEIAKLFAKYNAVVKKVILVQQIGSIIKIEKEIDAKVKQKQDFLLNNYHDYTHPQIEEFDKELEQLQQEVIKEEEKVENDAQKFEGIAFVSFQTEQMKMKVIETNKSTFMERYESFRNNGKLDKINPQHLQWNNQRLFIEQAPEPNEINWINIHAKTKDKIIGRLKSNVYTIIFVIILFIILFYNTMWKGAELKVLNATLQQNPNQNFQFYFKFFFFSTVDGWVIIIFNKFVIGFILKQFIAMEKISTKTKANIATASKCVTTLFINTAILMFIIQIIIKDNIVGVGGFIQVQTTVFLINAFLTLVIWILDPWYWQFQYNRNSAIDDSNTVITQQQANALMENPDYAQAKRYCEVMNTMWVTFFYGGPIPIGVILSFAMLNVYYWIDKYIVLRRRTIKDSISRDLSIEMIETLEMILILYAIGSLAMNYKLTGTIIWQDIVMIVLGVLYSISPIQDITDKIFPVEEIAESMPYEEAMKHFDTDYDRENPASRSKALIEWQKFQESIHHKGHDHAEIKLGYKDLFKQ